MRDKRGTRTHSRPEDAATLHEPSDNQIDRARVLEQSVFRCSALAASPEVIGGRALRVGFSSIRAVGLYF